MSGQSSSMLLPLAHERIFHVPSRAAHTRRRIRTHQVDAARGLPDAIMVFAAMRQNGKPAPLVQSRLSRRDVLRRVLAFQAHTRPLALTGSL